MFTKPLKFLLGGMAMLIGACNADKLAIESSTLTLALKLPDQVTVDQVALKIHLEGTSTTTADVTLRYPDVPKILPTHPTVQVNIPTDWIGQLGHVTIDGFLQTRRVAKADIRIRLDQALPVDPIPLIPAANNSATPPAGQGQPLTPDAGVSKTTADSSSVSGTDGSLDISPISPSSCVIEGQTYAAGDMDKYYYKEDEIVLTCQVCDPSKSQTAWSIPSGQCYINGGCYGAGDEDLSSDCFKCDPAQSQTSWTFLDNICRMGFNCVKPGATDPWGCGVCDPSKNVYGYTVVGSQCYIESADFNEWCYLPGATNAQNCGACDPTKSKTAWTPIGNQCQIGEQCYQEGDVHASQCVICAATSGSISAWQPANSAKVSSFNFENGAIPTGWMVSNADSVAKWQLSQRRPFTGKWSFYYGNPKVGNYKADNSSNNHGTITTGTFSFNAAKRALVRLHVYFDTKTTSTADDFYIDVLDGNNKITLWRKGTPQKVVGQAWTELFLDITSFAGKNIKLQFNFEGGGMNSPFNIGEGVFIDDITLYTDCAK